MIKFAHIAPTKYLSRYAEYNGTHLILAHLVESDEQYRTFYENLHDSKYKIMDNSAFEMFKQKRPMYESSKLIDMAKRCRAKCIVMSDYPREPWYKTMASAVDSIDQIKKASFDTFYVPQSELGDIKGYIASIKWALNEESIDIIGLSILACPIALGIDERMNSGERHNAYVLQRFMSRWKMFQLFDKAGILSHPKAKKRFHCLGMVDGPNEIELLSPYEPFIRSWDSSAAIWAGLHGVSFDASPTGLLHGKFEKEVDFQSDFGLDGDVVNDQIVLSNIRRINKLTNNNIYTNNVFWSNDDI